MTTPISTGLCGNTNNTWNLELCNTRAGTTHLTVLPYPSVPLDGPAYQLDKINLYEALVNQSASSLPENQRCSIFLDLVDASGLAANLQQVTRFTVLAPVNTAFLRLTSASAKAIDDARAAAVAGKKVALKDFVIAHIVGGGNRFLVEPVGTSAALCRAQVATSVLSTTLYAEIPPASRPKNPTTGAELGPVPDLSFTLVPLQKKCPMSNLHSNPTIPINQASAPPAPSDQETNFVRENVVCTNGIFHTIDGVLVVPNTTATPSNLLNVNVPGNPPVADVGI